MDMNRLTLRSQEAVQEAQTEAIRHGHQEVDGEHLLLAILHQDDGLFPRLLNQMDIPVEPIAREVEREVEGRPKVTGPGAQQGSIYVTQRFQQLLVSAEDEARRLKDEYVSVEHLVLALIEEGSSTSAGRILAAFQVTREPLLNVLNTVRGNQRITSATPESC